MSERDGLAQRLESAELELRARAAELVELHHRLGRLHEVSREMLEIVEKLWATSRIEANESERERIEALIDRWRLGTTIARLRT
jgi:hypothetical protein